MYSLLLVALLMPGTRAPTPDTAEAPKRPQINAPAQAALRGLVQRCVADARKTAPAAPLRESVGSTAYALTFDPQGRIAAIDFRDRLDAPLSTFQTCMRDGLQPWPLLAEGQAILRMGWPSLTTPNPTPARLPTRPWHVVKPAHVCPAVGTPSAPCVTADGQGIKGPQPAQAALTILRRYHHIERIGVRGEGATAVWRVLQAARVKPNRVDVREESGAPLQIEVRRWRSRREE